jgi:hypothetical protein
MYIYIISHRVLFRIKNFSNSLVEKIKTNFVLNIFFSEKLSVFFLDNVEEYGTARQAKDWNKIRRRMDAICMLDN